jgi:hypothetical protein
MSLKTLSDQRCQHVNSRGRRCRMLVAGDRSSLCPHHLNLSKAESRQQDEAVAAELLGWLEDFTTPDSVNIFLGNLLKLLARKRIDRRDAVAQAYVCQLILNTFPAMQRHLDAEKDSADLSAFLLGGLMKRAEDAAPGHDAAPDPAAVPAPQPQEPSSCAFRE